MKKILLLLCFLPSLIFAYPSHPKELSSPLAHLYRYEKSKAILERAESQGPITLKIIPFGNSSSGALWSPEDRTICLNSSRKIEPGVAIRSILFELHNSLSSYEFDAYDKMAREGSISRGKYIEAIEYIEYRNVLSTVEILEAGIKEGFFPSTSRWMVAPSFREHLAMQKQTGHSAHIGTIFDYLTYNHRALVKR